MTIPVDPSDEDGRDHDAIVPGEGRRSWRARTGAKPERRDLVWNVTTSFALFPGVGMVLAALGGGRLANPRMGPEETWIWMLTAALVLLALVLAAAVRRASGTVPARYPSEFFVAIVIVAIVAPAFAWVRLAGELPPLGWSAVGVCAALTVVSSIMVVSPRRARQ